MDVINVYWNETVNANEFRMNVQDEELYYLIQDELEAGNSVDEFGMRELFQRVVEAIINNDVVAPGIFSRYINAKFGLDEKSLRESDNSFDYGVAFACAGIYDEFCRVIEEGVIDAYQEH